MTTLFDDGEALVVRCDECRRLWPITAERLDSGRWSHDEQTDIHLCPVCAEQLVADPRSGDCTS
jgi:predicted RNA-binding Zn-ribbon protein involved in translation (DUF1610 family)